MINFNKYYFVPLLLFFISCEDQFSSIKEIDLPPHEPVLAVVSHFESKPISLPINSYNHFAQKVFVSNSVGALEQEPSDYIKDATVELYHENNLISSLTNSNFEFNFSESFYFDSTITALDPGEYTLRVSAPGFTSIEVSQTLPNTPEIGEISFEKEKIPIGFESQLNDLLEIEIIDPVDEENYYSFDIYYEFYKLDSFYYDAEKDSVYFGEAYDTTYYEMRYFESNDPLFEFGDRFDMIIPDVGFNGDSYKVRLALSPLSETSGRKLSAIHIYTHNLSKDAYLFETSKERYFLAIGNPFAEPVIIHSNVENGLGTFSLGNTTYKKIEL